MSDMSDPSDSTPLEDHAGHGLSNADLDVLRRALGDEPGWDELSRSLQEAARSMSSEALGRLSMAFVYDLVPPSQDARRGTAGGPYASMLETDDGSFPPRPPDVPDKLWETWIAARDAVDHPIVSSRINDLLYGSGRGGHDLGRVAAHDLMAVVEFSSWSGLDRADALARAMEILTELGLKDALARAAARAVALVDELLVSQPHPGPPFIVLRALLALKRSHQPDLDDLMDRVIATFDGDAGEHAVALAADATAREDRREGLRRKQLELRIAAAEHQTGLGKVLGLRRAMELAARYGFHEDARDLHKRQQSISTADLGLETFTSEVEIPRKPIQAEIDLYVGSQAADIFDAMTRLGQLPPPGGSNDDLDAEAAEQNRQHPIANLFGHALFGLGSAAPIYIANTEEAKRLLQRGRTRRLHADFSGELLVAPMLIAAADHHGRPTHDDLAGYFTTDLIGAARADKIARAFELFWDQDSDAAAHVVVPRLESIIREAARLSGISVLKVAQERRFGGYISLSTTIARLRELAGASPWLDYLDALLCDPLALNLRNDIAHGVIERVGAGRCALLLHAACHLRLWTSQLAE
jgi:hypothetical protein